MTEVVPRGKHLLMRLLDRLRRRRRSRSAGLAGRSERGRPPRRALTIHSHLKMEGNWHVYPPGGRWRKPGHTARCVLRTGSADAVGFSLGILEVVPTADEDTHRRAPWAGLARPRLGRGRSPAQAPGRTGRPGRVRSLDQRKLAGIGNIYRCEACFLSGVHPTSPVGSVPDLAKIVNDAKRLLGENLGPGRTWTTPWSPRAMRPGYWVYGRERQPCRRCGTMVRRALLAAPDGTEERDIYFCPHCQPVLPTSTQRT